MDKELKNILSHLLYNQVLILKALKKNAFKLPISPEDFEIDLKHANDLFFELRLGIDGSRNDETAMKIKTEMFYGVAEVSGEFGLALFITYRTDWVDKHCQSDWVEGQVSIVLTNNGFVETMTGVFEKCEYINEDMTNRQELHDLAQKMGFAYCADFEEFVQERIEAEHVTKNRNK